MMSVRSNWPMRSWFTRKYACSGVSSDTPLGMYTNEPPDHTAEFIAANLLSCGGMTVAKCSRKRSGCFLSPSSIESKMTPLSSHSFLSE